MPDSKRILLVTRDPCPQWQMDIRNALVGAGHHVTLRRKAEAKSDTVTDLLRLINRPVMGHLESPWQAGEPVPRQPENDCSSGDEDLLVDLAGGDLPANGGMALVPLYDGRPGEAAVLEALLGERAPKISIAGRSRPGDDWRIYAEGLPSLEHPRSLVRSIDRILCTTSLLIPRAVAALTEGREGPRVEPAPPAAGGSSLAPIRFAAGSVVKRIAAKARRLAARPDHWRIGWRRTAEGVQQQLAFPAEDYEFLPDDGRRYFADPFLFQHEGVTHLFCEEFDYASGKGLLAATTFGSDGRPGTPRTVLEAPYHLSYPQVFSRDGQIWMIPETCAAGRIELWRAERFPDRWALERVLVPDVLASDATLVEHGGRLWLFATVADLGSTWDSLSLWYADDLLGPWQAHPANPVLIDARGARPAGAFFRRGEKLWRPVQDCTAGYGSGLVLCRVDRLDPEDYRQSALVHLPPRPEWRACGTHTLNVGGGYEVIDVVGSRLRF